MSKACNHINVNRVTRKVGSVGFTLLRCGECDRVQVDPGADWVELDGEQADTHLLAIFIQDIQRLLAKQWTFR